VQITWLTQNFGRQEAAFDQYCFQYGVSKRDLGPLLPACLPKILGSQVICTLLLVVGS
jgi:hypothetical protein